MKPLLWYTSALGLVVLLILGLETSLGHLPAAPTVSWSLFATGATLGSLPVLAIGWRVGLPPLVLALCVGLLVAMLGGTLAVVGGPGGALPYGHWVCYTALAGTGLIVLLYGSLTLASGVAPMAEPVPPSLTCLFAGALTAAGILVSGPGLFPLPPWTAGLYVAGGAALLLALLWTVALSVGVAFLPAESGRSGGHWVLLFGLLPSLVAYLGLLLLLVGTYVAETVL